MNKLNYSILLCGMSCMVLASGGDPSPSCDSADLFDPTTAQQIHFVNEITFDNQYNNYFQLKDVSDGVENKTYQVQPMQKLLTTTSNDMPYPQFKAGNGWRVYHYEISQMKADGTIKKPNKVTVRVNLLKGSTQASVSSTGLQFAGNIIHVSSVCNKSTICSTTTVKCRVILDPYADGNDDE